MFHGAMTALVTPMLVDGTIDVDSLRALVEWQIESGSTAIIALGSTGEAATLIEDERELVVSQIIEQVNQRIPIIVGTGSNSTQQSIHWSRQAMALGADACLVVNPYYNKPPQQGVYEHYKKIAEAVPIPQILYNSPDRTGGHIALETIEKLAEIPNIIGIKETIPDMQRIENIKQIAPDLDIYSGDDATALDCVLHGGKGFISVAANVIPKQMNTLCQLALEGKIAEATALHRKLSLLFKALFVQSNPIPAKWMLAKMGKIKSGIRLPLIPLESRYQSEVNQVLTELNLISEQPSHANA